jgi:hypothetical protein
MFIAKVPKGAKYFLGMNGDIVSDQLIVSNREYIFYPNAWERLKEWFIFKFL